MSSGLKSREIVSALNKNLDFYFIKKVLPNPLSKASFLTSSFFQLPKGKSTFSAVLFLSERENKFDLLSGRRLFLSDCPLPENLA
jgi:hypothetical protein